MTRAQADELIALLSTISVTLMVIEASLVFFVIVFCVRGPWINR